MTSTNPTGEALPIDEVEQARGRFRLANEALEAAKAEVEAARQDMAEAHEAARIEPDLELWREAHDEFCLAAGHCFTRGSTDCQTRARIAGLKAAAPHIAAIAALRTPEPNGDAGDAIDWALDHFDGDTRDFLESWREGDLAECPNYLKWVALQQKCAVESRASTASCQQSPETPTRSGSHVSSGDMSKGDAEAMCQKLDSYAHALNELRQGVTLEASKKLVNVTPALSANAMSEAAAFIRSQRQVIEGLERFTLETARQRAVVLFQAYARGVAEHHGRSEEQFIYDVNTFSDELRAALTRSDSVKDRDDERH